MSEQAQESASQEFPDLTSSLVSMDEIQAIIDVERAERHARETKVEEAETQQSSATATYWTENGVNYQLMNAVKEDLEKLQKIERGEYVAPESDPYEGLRPDTREMMKWLDQIRSIEAEAKAKEEQEKAEQVRIEQETRDAETRRLRKENKELGDSVALYILMRTDMASLNPGKAVAQGTHAANLFEKDVRVLREGFPEAPNVLAYEAWAADRGFGTAITLGVTGENLRSLVEQAQETGAIAGICTDPTYPLRDGDVTHLLNIDTCGYIFGNRTYLAEILGHLDLMR